MTAVELARDDKFRKDWPYLSERLKKYLTQRQLDFAAKNKGDYEKIGRYVEFQQEIFESLADLDALTQEKPPGPDRPKKLHNQHFQSPQSKPLTTTPNG